jgi:hypothetical protein
MDDIRRPHRPERRDYGLPEERPHHAPQPQHPPHHIPVSTPGQDSSPTAYTPPVQAHAPSSPPMQPAYHQQPQTQTHSQPHTQHQAHPHASQQQPIPAHHAKRKIPKPLLIIIGIFVATALVAVGFFLKPSDPQNTIPAHIVQQVDYSLYFPSPMPPGYTYMKDTATFQIGQVFYKFSNGQKRVTVKEEPMPQPKPDFNLLSDYAQFDAPVGKAAIGSTFGHPTAIVLAGNTVITMNTSGGVSQDELKTAVNNLKNIGRNPKNG